MMKSILVLFFLTFTVLGAFASELPRRQLKTDWDPIEGAASYDLELKSGSRVLNFKTKSPEWAGRLTPGVYEMRLRANDERGVPGEWADPVPFKVHLDTPAVMTPTADLVLRAKTEDEIEVPFKWQAVPGAKNYELEIRSAADEVVKRESVKDTEVSLKFETAKVYKWSITAIGTTVNSETAAKGEFKLIGKQLDPVKLQKPENDFVRQVSWTPSDDAKGYKYSIDRFNEKEKKWTSVQAEDLRTDTAVNIEPAWPGGRYRIDVRARNELRADSPTKRLVFQVRHGDRSPAAENIATLRQSIERRSSWYSIASYLITIMNYEGVNFDRSNSRLQYNAIGGTGRLGAGYLPQRSPYGFLGFADLSGFTVSGGGTYTFAAAEANLTYRHGLADSEFRHQLGGFYKELPETIGPSSTQITATENVKVVGLHYGVEYWRALTPKLGMQLNAHLYPSLLTIKTMNGLPISPTLSYRLGVLGSYRLSQNWTGLAGYAYCADRIEYKAQEGQGSARAGNLNTVQITGHYLNFLLEWSP